MSTKTAATKAAKRTSRVIESSVPQGAGMQVDQEAGIIRGVKALGRESSNGRTYTDKALQDFVRLCEGLGVYVDHDRENPVERSVRDKIGYLTNPVLKSDGIYADLVYLKSHPVAAQLVEIAERMPGQLGLSQHAFGETVVRGGKVIVELIERIESVDLVTRPATTGGLFESQEHEPMKKLKAFVESIDAKTPGRKAILTMLIEEDMAAMADAPVADMPAESSSDDQIKAAFRAMVVAAFDDEALDSKATLARIKEVLSAYEKLNGGATKAAATESEDPPADKEKEAMAESVAARKEIATELLEAAGIKVDSAKVNALAALTDAKERKSLVESWKPSTDTYRVQKPLISRPLVESATSYPSDAKSFASSILN